jgi:hypothetical protein
LQIVRATYVVKKSFLLDLVESNIYEITDGTIKCIFWYGTYMVLGAAMQMISMLEFMRKGWIF